MRHMEALRLVPVASSPAHGGSSLHSPLAATGDTLVLEYSVGMGAGTSLSASVCRIGAGMTVTPGKGSLQPFTV